MKFEAGFVGVVVGVDVCVGVGVGVFCGFG